ncbi:MAG TPA: zf-HC2 domain-containing protein [Gemmatimonadaceae bacterium]
MNSCMEIETREMLPDLLHGKLDTSARARVEKHVAGCEECREELEVLRTVKAAAIFAPTIDVNRVVGHIAPYARIAPEVEAPARSRVVSWLVAASFLVVIAGGGSLLVVQQKDSVAPYATATTSQRTNVVSTPVPVLSAGGNDVASVERPVVHTLALASGVETLSDNDLRQLMTDMDSFDALPNAEPEPVMNVDNGDNSDQGTR